MPLSANYTEPSLRHTQTISFEISEFLGYVLHVASFLVTAKRKVKNKMSEMPPVPPTPPAGGPAPQPVGPLTPEQDKNFAGLSHLLGGAVAALATLFALWSLIPTGTIVGAIWVGPRNIIYILLILAVIPSIIFYFVYKDRGPWTAQESKEALNFQIWVAGASIVLWILSVILVLILGQSQAFAYSLLSTGGLALFNIVMIVLTLVVLALAAINVWFSWNGYNAIKRNEAYRYPILPVRFVK